MNWKEQFDEIWKGFEPPKEMRGLDLDLKNCITKQFEALINEIPDGIGLYKQWIEAQMDYKNINGELLKKQLKDKWLS